MTDLPRISLAEARALLGVAAGAGEADLRRAFHAAVLRAHPDRPGGGVEAFSRVMDAYGRLKNLPVPPDTAPPPLVDEATELVITPDQAVCGGDLKRCMRDGRTISVLLPPGLRAGDRLRAGDIEFTIAIRPTDDIQVRGDDLWITARRGAQCGRLVVRTPAGEQVVWATRKTVEQGLVRVARAGLPARGPHPAGDLYLRLQTEDPAESDSRARRRRFAATWAA